MDALVTQFRPGVLLKIDEDLIDHRIQLLHCAQRRRILPISQYLGVFGPLAQIWIRLEVKLHTLAEGAIKHPMSPIDNDACVIPAETGKPKISAIETFEIYQSCSQRHGMRETQAAAVAAEDSPGRSALLNGIMPDDLKAAHRIVGKHNCSSSCLSFTQLNRLSLHMFSSIGSIKIIHTAGGCQRSDSPSWLNVPVASSCVRR